MSTLLFAFNLRKNSKPRENQSSRPITWNQCGNSLSSNHMTRNPFQIFGFGNFPESLKRLETLFSSAAKIFSWCSMRDLDALRAIWASSRFCIFVIFVSDWLAFGLIWLAVDSCWSCRLRRLTLLLLVAPLFTWFLENNCKLHRPIRNWVSWPIRNRVSRLIRNRVYLTNKKLT